jgi:Na+-translocating ferredoxin:NAD+ oxidoreductase RnfC subunit
MRGLLFGGDMSVADPAAAFNLFCCECNLCSLISCPEGLYPAQACILTKRALVKGKLRFSAEANSQPHPLIAYRRTPMQKVMSRLDLSRFNRKAPLMNGRLEPRRLEMKLRQHVGIQATSIVNVGDRVAAAQKIATVGEELGAEIHSPIAGYVSAMTADHIVIDRAES